MLHLAEVTGKQTSSQSLPPLRSLFEPTINIFDSSTPPNQSRLRYYIKPYRGDTYIPPDTTKQRSRSLSEQRLAQQSLLYLILFIHNEKNIIKPCNVMIDY
jgi:hypothetical protein